MCPTKPIDTNKTNGYSVIKYETQENKHNPSMWQFYTLKTSSKCLKNQIYCSIKNKRPTIKVGLVFGRGSKIRTHDTRFWRPMLYQLSYTPN